MARASEPEPATPVEPEPAVARKGQPTPTRREQEAARRRPLVPKDRRLARRQSRQQLQVEREKARIGMANGEERYLTIRDKGPQKRFVRDFVDARFSAGEILMPMLVLVILTWFVPAIADYAFLAFWGIFVLVVIDCFVLGFQVRKRLAAKFGAERVERGVRWYAAMRAVQMRPLRLPKPQVKRGAYPS